MTDRNESRLMPAIAAGVMSSDATHTLLLQSIVDSARGDLHGQGGVDHAL